MTQCTELWVDRADPRRTTVVTRPVPAPGQGEVLVAIDKFGLTSNNVSYAVTGDLIGYWGYYPAEDNWGKVPVWGCAEVVASGCDQVPVGDRLWGFFPMASHAILQPGKVREDQFVDVAAHRQALPALYNGYRRTRAEPAFLQDMESPEELRTIPTWKAHQLTGDRKGTWSLFVSRNWRITFRINTTGIEVEELHYEDYH